MCKVKIGDMVYGYDSYGNLQSVKVKRIELILKGGLREVPYVVFGTGFCLPEEMVFSSKEDCVQDYQNRFEEKVQDYCKSIKSVPDLVSFMFNHCVSCAEEYTDWEAREAAYRKAKELLGIDLREV